MKRLRLKAPIFLEIKRSGATFAAAVVEDGAASLRTAAHDFPILEVVGRPRSGLLGIASIERKDFVAPVKSKHAAE